MLNGEKQPKTMEMMTNPHFDEDEKDKSSLKKDMNFEPVR